jgi:quercetin dioxygenase-like cupin family protein
VSFERRDDLPIRQGDLICLPSDQFHSIKAAEDSRMGLVYFMKPGYGSVRPYRPIENPAIDKLHGER